VPKIADGSMEGRIDTDDQIDLMARGESIGSVVLD
jgi:hypothetical protein